MKILLTTVFLIAAVTSLVHAQEGQLRLPPSEINALAAVNGGAGTSGVSGIQTRALKGDATKPGIYTIPVVLQITGNGPTGTEYVEAGANSTGTKTNYESLFANV